MNRASTIRIAVLSVILLGTGIFLWRTMSRKYLYRWETSGRRTSSSAKPDGNVCTVSSTGALTEPISCINVSLYPDVLKVIGVNDERLIQWQNDNGFHSDGVDRQGNLLAPGYPIFSRLAWTHVDPVYLHGNELAALRDEANRIAKSANNPSLEVQLNELVTLAAKAQGNGSGLRFFA